jgi:hypothetical protein
MLEFLRGKASDRKLRLFAVACARRVGTSLQQDQFRYAIRAAELFADGMVTREAMSESREVAIAAFEPLPGGEEEAPAAAISAAGIPAPKKSYWERLLDAVDDPWWEDELDQGDPHAAAIVTSRHAAWAAAHEKGQVPVNDAPAQFQEEREQAFLIHDIFGNSFQHVPLDPTWHTPKVVKLGQEIYDNYAFDRLLVLADALEEAGCDNAEMLAHCRAPGPHVRGCWVVDLPLGKE